MPGKFFVAQSWIVSIYAFLITASYRTLTYNDTTKQVKNNGIQSIYTAHKRAGQLVSKYLSQPIFLKMRWFKNWQTFPTRIETCTETNCDTILALSFVLLFQFWRLTKRRANVSIRSRIEDNNLWMLWYNVSNVWIRQYNVSIALEVRHEVGISFCRCEVTHHWRT